MSISSLGALNYTQYGAINQVNMKQSENNLPKSSSVFDETNNSSNNTDTVHFTKENAEIIDMPEIGFIRVAFNRLTDEQIAAINKNKKLPNNAKFVPDGQGRYIITNNIANIRVGTQTLPAGFEVKKDAFGFTCVVPEGSHGLLLK